MKACLVSKFRIIVSQLELREKAACHRQLVHLVEHPLRCQPDQEVQHGSPEQRPTGGKPRHVAVTEEEEDVGTAFREGFRHVRGNISHFRLRRHCSTL